MRAWRRAVLVLAVVSGTTLFRPVPVVAAPSPPRSWLAVAAGGLFTADHSGRDAQLIVPAGQGVDRQPFNPAISPDGSRIAYMYDWAIWVVGADGSNPTRLTFGGRLNVPRWSADGSRIYSTSLGEGTYTTVGWISPDGTRSGLLPGPNGASISNAVWSPDGRQVAFATGQSAGGSVDVMNADGTGHRVVLANTAGRSAWPVDWSPDGTRLLLDVVGPSGFELVVINADGTDRTTVRTDAIADAWSPDGSRLLYHRNSDATLWTIRVDGSGERRVGDLGGAADWGPGTVDPDPSPSSPPPTTPPTTTAPVPPGLDPRPPYPGPASPPTTAPATRRSTTTLTAPTTRPGGHSPPAADPAPAPPAASSDPVPTSTTDPPEPAFRPLSADRALSAGLMAALLLVMVLVAIFQSWLGVLRRRSRRARRP